MAVYYDIRIQTDEPRLIPSFLDDEGNFCFDKVIPMPKSLEMESGSVTERAIVYYATERLTKPARKTALPKFLSNSFYDSPEEWVEELERRLREEVASEQNLDRLYELGKQYVFNLEHYGFSDWYPWRLKHWNAKWDAMDTEFQNPGEVFFTATGVPLPIFREICERFPGARILFSVDEEDFWRNAGGTLVEGTDEQQV